MDGPVQGQHYSLSREVRLGNPWGLAFSTTIAPPSGAGGLDRFTYNSKELLTDLDLGWNDGVYPDLIGSARMYMSEIGRWNGVDPLAEKYQHLSPYNYVANNPVNAIDPDGRLIFLVNGHWNRIANKLGMSPGEPKEAYWNYFDRGFIGAVSNFFNDKNFRFEDGSSKIGFDQSGGNRFKRGQKWAEKNYESLMAGLADGETIKLVGHSEGSAYAAGIADYFIKRAKKDGKGSVIESMLHLSPDEADEFNNPKEPTTYRIHNILDPVSPAFYYLSGVDYEMITAGYKKVGFDEISQSHGRTVTAQAIRNLQSAIGWFIDDPNVQKITNEDGSVTYKRTGQ